MFFFSSVEILSGHLLTAAAIYYAILFSLYSHSLLKCMKSSVLVAEVLSSENKLHKKTEINSYSSENYNIPEECSFMDKLI